MWFDTGCINNSSSKLEPLFLNVYGAPESIPMNEFRQPIFSLAARYDNPLPPRVLAPIASLKIPALVDRLVEDSTEECSEQLQQLLIKIKQLSFRTGYDSWSY
jgi:hypothetical protein